MSTEYDAKVLQVYADDLYQQARYVVFTTALRYSVMTLLLSLVILGAFFAYISHGYQSPDSGSQATLSILIVTIIGIAVGINEGRRKAFRLKLEAQQILCQRQIEINTRRT